MTMTKKVICYAAASGSPLIVDPEKNNNKIHNTDNKLPVSKENRKSFISAIIIEMLECKVD